jgi:hypothetical protein
MRYSFAVALLVGSSTFSTMAAADRTDSTTPSPDKARSPGATPATSAEQPSRWRGSIALFDQSLTTQTLGFGKGYQSSDQTYEMWIALKPRFVLYEAESKKTTLAVNGWTNLYLELTNSDGTTTEHEPVLGPTFFSLNLSQVLFDNGGGYKTSISLGPRVTLPTDKESRNRGRLGAFGATGGLSQSIPIQGKGAPAWNSMRFGASFIYGHSFNRATTPTASEGNQKNLPIRQDMGGRLVHDDQLSSSMNVHDSVNVSFSGGLQITPKLDFGLSYIIINSWAYWPTPATILSTPTGPAPIESIDNPTNHRVSTWFLASMDYEAMDEMSVGIGYYNSTGQIGPDGQRRGFLWSPDARIFLTATANLDVIFSHFTSTPAAPAAPAKAPAPVVASATENASAK